MSPPSTAATWRRAWSHSSRACASCRKSRSGTRSLGRGGRHVALLIEALSPLEKEADETLHLLWRYLSEQNERIAAAQPTSEELGVLLRNLTGDERRKLEQLIAAVADSSAGALDAATLQTVRIYATRAMQYLDRLQRELETTLPWIGWLRTSPALLAGPQAAPLLAEHWRSLVQELPTDLAWGDVPAACSRAAARLAEIVDEIRRPAGQNHNTAADEAVRYCEEFAAALAVAQSTTAQLFRDLASLATQADTYVQEMDFRFLSTTAGSLPHRLQPGERQTRQPLL